MLNKKPIEKIEKNNPYTEHISISELQMNHYKTKKSFTTPSHFHKIETWLETPTLQNAPLIIKTSKNQSQKTFLTNWIYHHLKNSQKTYKDVIIPNFVNYQTKQSSQFYIIYNTITKLREIFNIKRNVDNSEENLRMNFQYWLDLVNRKIMKNPYFDGDLIVVIEGAHLILDGDKGLENNLKFWLPKFFPERVRFIISLEQGSFNFEYFHSFGCCVLDLACDRKTVFGVLEYFEKKRFFIRNGFVRDMFKVLKGILGRLEHVNEFFVEVFVCCFMPFSENEDLDDEEAIEKIMEIFGDCKRIKELIKKIEVIKSFEELVGIIIDFYSSDFTDETNYKKILGLLCYSHKGLKFNEIRNIASINKKSIAPLCIIMKVFFINYKNYYKITNQTFIKVLNKKTKNQKDFKKNLHIKISEKLQTTPDTLRKLEEQTNNLYLAKEYFSLKQKISTIENFITIYNQITKFDLFKFWTKLEKKGYDPVHEYNKAFQLFVMHYNPSDADIFLINVQISRFFKELSDFESELTPEFRHPFIKGKIVQDVSLIGNLKKGASFEELEGFREIKVDFLPRFLKMEEKDGFFKRFYEGYASIFRDDEMESGCFLARKKGNGKPIIDYLEEIGILDELENVKILGEKNLILKKHESINIDIPLNKKKFEKYFIDILKEKNKFKNFVCKSEKEYDFDISDFEDKKDNQQNLLIISNKKKDLDPITKKIQNIDLNIKPLKEKKYYYYKRWIWMNFPVICMSKQKYNFSEIITYCYSEIKSYLDFEQDKNLYLKTLEIILHCKKKKNIGLSKSIKNESFINDGKNSKLTILPKNDKSIFKRKFSTKKIKSKNLKELKVFKKSKKHSEKSLALKKSFKTILPKIKKSQSIIISKSQLKKNIYQSKFKKVLKLKNKKINQILITQNNLSQPITNILQKAKFKEDRVFKKNLFDLELNIFKKEKNMNFKEKTLKLHYFLEKYSKEEINVLDLKLKEIIGAVNFVYFEIEQIKVDISKMEKKKNVKENKKEVVENISKIKNKYEMKEIFFEKKKNEIKKKYKKVIKEKKRYEQIIDIGLINQIQNEDWIRSLNFYLTNLKKLSLEKKNDYLKKKNQKTNLKKLTKKIYFNYQKNLLQRKEVIENFKKFIESKKTIDSALMNSDKLILQEIEKTKKNKKISNKEELKIKQTIRKKRKNIEFQMINKIRDFKILYKNFEPLFENDFSNISEKKDLNFESIIQGYKKDWYKSDFYHKLMNFVNIRKNLDLAIFKLKAKIEDLEERNLILKKKEEKKINFGEEKEQEIEVIDKEEEIRNLKRFKDLGILKS